MNVGRIIISLLVTLACLTLVANAQEIEVEELYDLTLEEMMNIEVVSASKRSESVMDAPAVVTVISASEIESYGAVTLQEVMERVVGTWSYGAFAVHNSIYAIRGATTTIDNLHILVLIDGRPTRENLRNGQYTSFYLSFPLESIERLEVIRGPGSVLYGSGAYIGVVNIVTKNGASQEATARVRYGTGDSYQFSGAYGKKINEFEVAVGLNAMDDGGWDYAMIDEKGEMGGFEFRRKGMGANLKAKYRDIRFNAYYGNSEQGVPSNTPNWLFDPRKGEDSLGVWYAKVPRLFLNAGYDLTLSEKATVAFDVTYNHFKYQNRIDGVGYEDFQRGVSEGVLFEVTGDITSLGKFDVVVGATANIQTGEFLFYYFNEDGSPRNILTNTTIANPPFVAVPRFNTTWATFYAQVDYQLLPFWKLVVGGQLNFGEGLDANVVPRVANLIRISEHWGAKLMVSRAYRAPIGLQTDLANPGRLFGNSDLVPETNTTYEAQAIFANEKIEASLTYYHINSYDLITRSLPSDSLLIVDGLNTQTFINRGKLQLSGVEFEGKYNIGYGIFTNWGLNYATNKDNEGRRDFQGTPRGMVKLGLAFQSKKGVNLSLFNTWHGDVKPITIFDNQGNQVTQEVNPNPDAFSYLSANLTLQLNQLFNFSSKPAIALNVYATNLLDEDIWMAEYSRRRINSTPSRGGKSIYGGVRLKF